MDRTTTRYQGAQGIEYQTRKRGIPSRAVPWVAAVRAAKLQPWISPQATVFEYGAAQGWNLAQIRCQK